MKHYKKYVWIFLGIIASSGLAFVLIPQSTQENVKITDQNATKQTKALYSNLKKIAAKGVMFGHQDDLAYGVHWENEKDRSDVKDVCGDYPAIYGWDIGWLGVSTHNLDSVSFKSMKKWMLQAYKRGGINTISWHMNNLETDGGSWDKTPAVKHILPNGKKHEVYLQRLDAFAKFAKSLRPGWFKKPIPIVFRPFHEHTGSWFWWGKGNCTADEYKQLWRFTVDYLRNEKGVHNLLYCYSTDIFSSREQYLEFYPGDDYVDILGVDNYHHMKGKEGDYEKTVQMFEMLSELAAEKDKIATLSETGLESIPMETWWTEMLLKAIKHNDKTSRIAWALVWRNDRPGHHFGPHKGHKSAPNFVKFYQDDFTIFEKDLPNMYRFAQ